MLRREKKIITNEHKNISYSEANLNFIEKNIYKSETETKILRTNIMVFLVDDKTEFFGIKTRIVIIYWADTV